MKTALFCAVCSLLLSSSVFGNHSDSLDLSLCHSGPLEVCDARCAASCRKVLLDNSSDAMAYYKLAQHSLSSASESEEPFMPEVDTDLRMCSMIGSDDSALCEMLYATVMAYPQLYHIRTRPENPEAALAWAALAGKRDLPAARWQLAAFLAYGLGADSPDLKTAYRLMNEDAGHKPDKEFALLNAMLLEHGWGGPENVLEADRLSRVGYGWLENTRKARPAMDRLFLAMITDTAYLLGDGRLIHESAWGLTVGKRTDEYPKYSIESVEDIIDEDDENLLGALAGFYGRELLAAELDSPDAAERIRELEEVLKRYELEDLMQEAHDYMTRSLRDISRNRKEFASADTAALLTENLQRVRNAAKGRKKSGGIMNCASSGVLRGSSRSGKVVDSLVDQFD
ncbi:MAG: hypothetical protein IJ523_00210 [Succinivibrionaceae bacterium]|nr:hypothetical protein [Succinivibrionaceae bacterium]